MSITVITRQGDMVDDICYRHYGYESGVTEQVLATNQGLAARGMVLPAGVQITLPDVPARATETVVNLWD